LFLRRKLMDLDGQLLSLGAEAEKQHQLISQWESRNNKLYKNNSNNNSKNVKNGNMKWHNNMEESEDKGDTGVGVLTKTRDGDGGVNAE
jgi:hypothetical protein